MEHAITRHHAFVALLGSEQWGGSLISRIPLDLRPALQAEADADGVGTEELIASICEEGDNRDRRIARLEATIDLASHGLASWLGEQESDHDDVVDVHSLLDRIGAESGIVD